MDNDAIEEAIDFTLRKPVEEDEEKTSNAVEVEVHGNPPAANENQNKLYMADNGLYMLPKDHPDYLTLIKLQIENQVKNFICEFLSNFQIIFLGTNELETAVTSEN